DRGRVLHHPRPRIPAADPRCRPGGPGGGPGQRVAHPHRPAHRGRAAGTGLPRPVQRWGDPGLRELRVRPPRHACGPGRRPEPGRDRTADRRWSRDRTPYLYVMATVLLVNIVAVTLLYPTLKVTTFDPRFAMALGIRTGAVNAAFMFLVSVTVTAAFHAAGAILVIALMVAPPATAHLLTRRLAPMIVLTIALAAGGALAGFRIAYRFDAAT